MIIKTGIDLVYLPKFRDSLKRGGEIFLRRVFKEEELVINKARGGSKHLRGGVAPAAHLGGEIIHLAGIFAAKEAVIKALSLSTDSWHDIVISKTLSGSPEVKITNFQLLITNCSLSISHDGNYVIALYTAILEGDGFRTKNKT